MSRRDLLATALGALCIFALVQVSFAGSLSIIAYEHLWQLAAPAWLVDKSLWSVVLSFHSQPPGMLILQWAAANLTPKVIEFSLLFAAVAYVCCCSLIAAIVTGSRLIGLLAATYIALHPSTLLYSHWFFSPVYLAAFLSVNVILVLQWARTGDGRFLAWALVVLSLASVFHAAYLVAFVCFASLVVLFPPIRRTELRRPRFYVPLVIAASIAFFAPVKNLIVFDIFTPSSWSPLNLATVYTKKNPWNRCKAAILASDRAPNDFGSSRAAYFSGVLDEDLLFRPTKPKGAANLNHIEVLNCRERVQLAADFDFGAMGINLARAAFETLALPAWDYHWLGRHNLERTQNIVKIHELYVSRSTNPEFHYYRPERRGSVKWLLNSISLSSVVLSVIVIFCGADLLRTFVQRMRRRGDAFDYLERRELALAYSCLLALLILSVMFLANGQELNRMKFSMSPLFTVVFFEGLRRFHNRTRHSEFGIT